MAADHVNSEHSYGTRQRLASIREGDHAYSTKMLPLETSLHESIQEGPQIQTSHTIGKGT